MEEKLYGVKISRIKQLQTFQCRLREQRNKMPFIDNATYSYGAGLPTLCRIVATDNRISVNDKLTFTITKSTPIVRGPGNQITFTIEGQLLRIDPVNHSGESLIAALGLLELSSEESSESSEFLLTEG